MHRCAVSVPEITIKEVRLLKKVGISDHNALLWVYVAYDSQGKILPLLLWTSPDTSAVVVRSQLKTGLVISDYTLPVGLVPR